MAKTYWRLRLCYSGFAGDLFYAGYPAPGAEDPKNPDDPEAHPASPRFTPGGLLFPTSQAAALVQGRLHHLGINVDICTVSVTEEPAAPKPDSGAPFDENLEGR